MKLSLAIIAGNVQHLITRFLDSFEPLADEIIVVRAIGFQTPDDTLKIARERGCITAEYKNRIAHTDWPHVDDFASARQMAYDLATGDWIMWADTDDVIEPASVDLIRRGLELIPQREDAEKIDGIEIVYDVRDDGFAVHRERIMRPGSGKWVFPIHENFQFHKTPYFARIPGATIIHAPIGTRAQHGNDERNLRILRSIPAEKRSTSQMFHFFQSLRATGHTAEAVKEATAMLQRDDIGTAERYELLVACGQICNDPATRRQFLLQAVAEDPSRREAYGELVITSLAMGNAGTAIGWADSMVAHHSPREFAWNARRKYYSWLAPILRGMALRANGRIHEADAAEFNYFTSNGSKISLLHATRGRPKQANAAKFTWLDRALNPECIQHIFAIDADDEESIALAANLHVAVAPGGGCVRAWNAAAAISTGHILIQVSDDWIPPLHWDRLIIDRLLPSASCLLPSLPPAVLAISDGHRTDDLLCMAILTRARYRQQGYLFHPDFEAAAMYSDNYFTHCAQRDGVIIDARDIVFEHQHPAFDSSIPVDATYAAQNAPEKYAKGKEIFERLIA